MMNETISYIYQAPLVGTGLGYVIRSTDGASIPLDLANADYQAFLEWLAAGNAPPEGFDGPTN